MIEFEIDFINTFLCTAIHVEKHELDFKKTFTIFIVRTEIAAYFEFHYNEKEMLTKNIVEFRPLTYIHAEIQMFTKIYSPCVCIFNQLQGMGFLKYK